MSINSKHKLIYIGGYKNDFAEHGQNFFDFPKIPGFCQTNGVFWQEVDNHNLGILVHSPELDAYNNVRREILCSDSDVERDNTPALIPPKHSSGVTVCSEDNNNTNTSPMYVDPTQAEEIKQWIQTVDVSTIKYCHEHVSTFVQKCPKCVAWANLTYAGFVTHPKSGQGCLYRIYGNSRFVILGNFTVHSECGELFPRDSVLQTWRALKDVIDAGDKESIIVLMPKTPQTLGEYVSNISTVQCEQKTRMWILAIKEDLNYVPMHVIRHGIDSWILRVGRTGLNSYDPQTVALVSESSTEKLQNIESGMGNARGKLINEQNQHSLRELWVNLSGEVAPFRIIMDWQLDTLNKPKVIAKVLTNNGIDRAEIPRGDNAIKNAKACMIRGKDGFTWAENGFFRLFDATVKGKMVLKKSVFKPNIVFKKSYYRGGGGGKGNVHRRRNGYSAKLKKQQVLAQQRQARNKHTNRARHSYRESDSESESDSDSESESDSDSESESDDVQIIEPPNTSGVQAVHL